LASLTAGGNGGYWNLNNYPTGATPSGWGVVVNHFAHFAIGCIGTNNACNNAGSYPPGIEAARHRGIQNWYIQKIFETSFSNVFGMCAAAYTAFRGSNVVNPYHNLCFLYDRALFNNGGK